MLQAFPTPTRRFLPLLMSTLGKHVNSFYLNVTFYDEASRYVDRLSKNNWSQFSTGNRKRNPKNTGQCRFPRLYHRQIGSLFTPHLTLICYSEPLLHNSSKSSARPMKSIDTIRDGAIEKYSLNFARRVEPAICQQRFEGHRTIQHFGDLVVQSEAKNFARGITAIKQPLLARSGQNNIPVLTSTISCGQ